jgi:hypothetical protein
MHDLDPLVVAMIKNKVPEYYAQEALRLLNRKCFYRHGTEDEQCICTRSSLSTPTYIFNVARYFGELCDDEKFNTCKLWNKPPLYESDLDKALKPISNKYTLVFSETASNIVNNNGTL